jgi:hypothetical protein
MKLSNRFPAYTLYDPKVPVRCVTPHEKGTIHRFFDTSPFSPSGRYMALFRMPFENRYPLPGEKGRVVLVDLQEGTEEIVAETCGWESQMGAHVQWGATDNELFFNDVDTASWKPVGVKLNPFTGNKKLLEHGLFVVSPDGKQTATTCLIRSRRTQDGYGVIVPDEYVPVNGGLPEDDGVYVTDVETGKGKLLVSLGQILETLRAELDFDMYRKGQSYGFQCRWNLQGTRMLMLLRWLKPTGGEVKHAVTFKSDGTDIRLAVSPQEYNKGGHHINWHPDGEHLTMNLNIDRQGIRFVQFKYDGSGLRKLLENPGSGHPTVHPNGLQLLTDAYLKDVPAFGDGTTPIRWVNLADGTETDLVRINSAQPYDNILRVDPHPAWDAGFTHVAFNGHVDGTRKVFVADLSSVIKK